MLTNEDESFLEVPESPALADWEDDAFAAFAEEVDNSEDVPQYVPPIDDIERMLKALAGELFDEEQVGSTSSTKAQAAVSPSLSPEAAVVEIRPATLGVIDNPELAEAFLQDASRGIAMLDQAIIDFESQENREQAIASICRELHTLKGAAATVGLEDVGRYLHEIEDFVESQAKIAPNQFIETLLACAGTVRRQMAELSGSSASDGPTSSKTETLGRIDPVVDAEDSISVKASQLDRLMDMLAALVMLRNRRASRVEQLRRVNEEVARCGARLREVERRMVADDGGPQGSRAKEHSSPLHEVASDLLEIGRNLRECYDPVAEENVAVSNFIRQFRQALVMMLRMPVSGLFRRLQRAALDAARVESKRVRLEIVSLDAGLERSVQERLFDPLMHIVRNAVSHGIELPAEREKLGKDPVGTITLEATGTPNLLMLSVRDDGRGLDYEALRRRGFQHGLLSHEAEPTERELAQLIFHRGLSTRETTNEVAGRGIGMDVVVDTLDRMHAWAEVDSRPGEGTTITLTIPLRSIIEHAMVVRTGGKLFALPMLAIRKGHGSSEPNDALRLQLAHALGLNGEENLAESAQILVESRDLPARSGADSCVRVEVDELVGPEEVVVRPLPPILRNHNLFSGVTLSGNGEIVLVLDPHRLSELVSGCIQCGSANPRPALDKRTILIVDDSLSARRATANLCEKQGWLPVECADAAAALQRLQSGGFSAVITDFDMPEVDGLELIEAIRNNETYGFLPVIMISSRSVEEMEAAALNTGATRYLQKPITEAKIESIFQQLTFATEEQRDE